MWQNLRRYKNVKIETAEVHSERQVEYAEDRKRFSKLTRKATPPASLQEVIPKTIKSQESVLNETKSDKASPEPKKALSSYSKAVKPKISTFHGIKTFHNPSTLSEANTRN